MEYPRSKIESVIVNDHLGLNTDDTKMRPSVMEMVERIIEPNGYKIKKLKI